MSEVAGKQPAGRERLHERAPDAAAPRRADGAHLADPAAAAAYAEESEGDRLIGLDGDHRAVEVVDVDHGGERRLVEADRDG
jgi:hypothetical protein